jgi:ATP-binding cassette subfamily B protein
MFAFLWRNLKGYRLLVFLIMIASVFQVISAQGLLFAGKFMLDKVTNPKLDPTLFSISLGSLVTPFDAFAPGDELRGLHPGQHTLVGVLIFSAVALIVLGLIDGLLSYFQQFAASYIAQNLSASLRKKLFTHLERLSLDWHGKQKKGDIVQRVTGDIANIEKLMTDGLVDAVGSILTLVSAAVVMIALSWQFSILSLVMFPALFVVIFVYTKGIKAASKKASKAAGEVANVAVEDIGAITVLKAFTLEEREAMRFKKYSEKTREAGLRAGGLQAQFTPLVTLLVAAGTAIITGVGYYVSQHNAFLFIPAAAVSVGTVGVFIGNVNNFFQPMKDLSKLTNVGTAAAAGAERIQEVLDQAPEVVDNTAPYYGPTRLKGQIDFENVEFGYTKDRKILKGINLHIKAGAKVALVGLSGGGKTTLVKLIPRFYEMQSGSLRLDGVDNRMYPLNVLRQNVSMVLQESVLFEGTIRENIEIGRPGASEAEIIDAAKKANIHDVIMDRLGGYDRMLREQGRDLSGGQRQRMAIARAILRDAPILILDEPTASLDVESEAEVMNALDKLVENRTVLMISHRLSTLGNVDEIIVLKDGKIVEQGTYKELKRKGGIFAGLLAEQDRYNLEREGDKSILRSAFIDIPKIKEMPAPSPVVQVNYPVAQGNGDAGHAYNNAYGKPAASPMPAQPSPSQSKIKAARVLVEMDGKIIKELSLDKPVLTIGRLSGNDIQIPNQRVSRLHAKIHWENGTWVIEDAESVNGLVYQGNRVERLPLSNGDRVYVAPTAALLYRSN